MTTATVDTKKRVVVPTARPGQVLSIELNADGSILLVPVKAERKPQFPRGSRLKYFTPQKNREELELLKGCVSGPAFANSNILCEAVVIHRIKGRNLCIGMYSGERQSVCWRGC